MTFLIHLGTDKMWLLQGGEDTGGKVYHLLCGEPVTVGRKEGYILLSEDNSVSRSHATLTLTHPRTNLETKETPKVELKDLKSKYGTFLNNDIQKNKQLSPNVAHELHHGDRVRFGVLTNTWRLEYQPLLVTTSTLSNKEDKEQLINSLLTLGGHLQKDWSSDCCYLVMPAITFTAKVACALAAGRNIVLPEFFTKLVDAITNRRPHPVPADYLPPRKEQILNSAGASFKPDTRRAAIFAGLTFLFTTATQRSRISKSIHLASGRVEMLTEDNYTEVVSGKYLLISAPTNSQQSDALYIKTCALLKQHGLRTVEEGEIGLSILYMSTEGLCNASFKPSDIFKRSSSASQPSEKLKIFATETQATEFSVSLTGSKVVPESGVPQAGTSAQSDKPVPRKPPKRPLTTNDRGGGEAKRSNKAPSPDLTQPLSTLELCDDDDESEDKMEVTISKFKPGHTSTQVDDHPSLSTEDPSATISFAPYTLPTLKTLEPGEEEKTQPFPSDMPKDNILSEGVVWKEVKKVKPQVDATKKEDMFDEWWNEEEEDLGRKRVRDEETSPQQQESKKIKTNGLNAHNDSININNQDNQNGGSKKRKMPESDESIFSLPPRARQRERTVEKLSSKPSADSDLFALPARAPRARRLPSASDSASVPPTLPSITQDSTTLQTKAELSSIDSTTLPPTAEPAPLVTAKEEFDSSKFIDRDKPSTTLNSTDGSGEPTISRTLVVVEPMVMQFKPPCKPSPSASNESSCLPNFKVFKKVYSTCILKVIGGSDFVEYEHTAASQEFKIELDLVQKKQPPEKYPSFDEELFNLGGPTRRRR